MANQQAWPTAIKTPTLTLDAYHQYDVLGGLQTVSVQSAHGSGQIQVIQFQDADNEKAALDVYIFDSAPTTIADDALISGLAIADLKKLVLHKSIAAADWKNPGAGTIAWVSAEVSPVRPYYTTDGNLYVYVVCTGTPTYTAATDLSFRLWLLLD